MKRIDIGESFDAKQIEVLAAKLRDHGPLSGLGDPEAASLIRLAALVELASGEALIREDEDAVPEVYLLVDGALEVRSKSGTMARLSQPGDVIGEVAVMLKSRRTADVIADSAVRVLAIPAAVLQKPEFAEVAAAVSGAMIRDDWIKY